MNIAVTSTDQVVEIDGVLTRVWRGISEGGVPCDVYVRSVAVDERLPSYEFERDLRRQAAPKFTVSIPVEAEDIPFLEQLGRDCEPAGPTEVEHITAAIQWLIQRNRMGPSRYAKDGKP